MIYFILSVNTILWDLKNILDSKLVVDPVDINQTTRVRRWLCIYVFLQDNNWHYAFYFISCSSSFSIMNYCLCFLTVFNVSAHLDWMIRNLKMTIFHQMLQTLDRSIKEHHFEYIAFTKTRFFKILTFAMLDLWQIARAVYDVEEATSTAFEIILEHKVYLFFFPFPPTWWGLSFVHSIYQFCYSSVCMFYQMIKSETRASLVKFLQLMVAHHPSRR